jgi:hypothetical protein
LREMLDDTADEMLAKAFNEVRAADALPDADADADADADGDVSAAVQLAEFAPATPVSIKRMEGNGGVSVSPGGGDEAPVVGSEDWYDSMATRRRATTMAAASSSAQEGGDASLPGFRALDINGDGVLDPGEWVAGGSAQQQEAVQQSPSEREILSRARRDATTPRMRAATVSSAGGARRAPFVGQMRKHMGTQTLVEEVGELKDLRRTVLQTSSTLEGLGDQIQIAASSTSREYQAMVERKVEEVQSAANDRLKFVESRYERALLLARQAAGTERTHDLAKINAAQVEEIDNLRREYERRHLEETAQTKRERDEYKHRYETEAEGLKVLRREYKQLREEMESRLVSKEEFDQTKAQRDKFQKELERVTHQHERALEAAKQAEQRMREAVRLQVEAEAEALRQQQKAAVATAAAADQVEQLRAEKERTVARLRSEKAAAQMDRAESQRELGHERGLRAIVSERQASTIEKVVRENHAVKEKLRRIMRNTQPGHGSWEQGEVPPPSSAIIERGGLALLDSAVGSAPSAASAASRLGTGAGWDGNAEDGATDGVARDGVHWVERRPAGEGLHSGVDSHGYSTHWKGYGHAGGLSFAGRQAAAMRRSRGSQSARASAEGGLGTLSGGAAGPGGGRPRRIAPELHDPKGLTVGFVPKPPGQPSRLRLTDEGWRREPMGRPRSSRGSRQQGQRSGGKVQDLVWGGEAIYATG